MKSSRLFLPVAASLFAGLYMACEDNVSQIGGSLATGEVNIRIDSIEYDLHAVNIPDKKFDSRSGSLLMGNLNVPEYGSLNCSFVTRLMSISQFPDSMTVSKEKFNEFIDRIDSCSVQLYLIRDNFIGDGFTPLQATIYQLDRQLPNNIDNDFDPTGYYDPSRPLGKKNYTLSGAGGTDDSFYGDKQFQISVNVGKEFAASIYRKYQSDPQIFTWPQEFAKFIPGFYVTNTFGKGSVACYSQLTVNSYFHTKAVRPKTDSDGKTVKDENDNIVYESYMRKDSLVLCTTAPEVLSSNNIAYAPSEYIKKKIESGETIITTPGGYTTQITFPAKEIIRKYEDTAHNLSIVSSLSMTIPADTVGNNFGISTVPYLLLIKTSEVDKFFAKNSVPDNKTSFSATYNADIGGYRFAGLREYILSLIDKDEVTADDEDFSLIPVQISTETNSSSYYSSGATYTTKCVPYLGRPTMTRLDTDKARIVFTFSSQNLD